MGQVELLEVGQLLEVRTGSILLQVRETGTSSLVIEAEPAVAGVELVCSSEQQGRTQRLRISTRDSGGR